MSFICETCGEHINGLLTMITEEMDTVDEDGTRQCEPAKIKLEYHHTVCWLEILRERGR